MLRVLKYSVLSLAVAGLLVLPVCAQTGNGNDQSGTAEQPAAASPDRNISQPAATQENNPQLVEQQKVAAEGEGWILQPSPTQGNSGGGEGGVGGGGGEGGVGGVGGGR